MASLDLDVNGELALDDVEVDGDITAPDEKKNKKKRDGSTLRKAPQAPKRFKSSYICFFMAKQPEIKDELGDKATVTEISKRSAQMWRNLPAEERAHWDDVAAKDKQRYMVEKASYTGPWQVPWKRAKKDPSAPKRPMSAFLYFSQGRRRQIKDANPSLKNTEVSRLLGEMWRNAPEEERRPHIEKEKEEREKYKVAIADWRKDFEAKQEKERKAQAEQAAYMANMYPPPNGDPHQQQPHPYGDPNMMGQYPTQQPSHGMGPPPPPGQGYGYGAPPMYAYSYPVSPYQFPTNGKQPVILGPNGTPRYPPPGPSGAPSYGNPPPAGAPPSYGNPPPGHPPAGSYAPPPASNYGSAPPPHSYGSGPPPPSYGSGPPPTQPPPPPPQQGYEMQPAPHQHQHQHQHQGHHYDYLPPEHGGGMEHPLPPPPQQPQQQPQQQPLHHHHPHH